MVDSAEEKKVTRRSTQSITLAEVAAHAGVSPQTVSRSIRRPDLVSESTLKRVLASIAETGYVPNLAASNLASNRSYTVAVLIPAVSASVFAEMIQGIDSVLAPHGYHLFIGTTEYSLEGEETTLRALLGRRPDGVILVGTEHTPGAQALLRASKVPLVESWEITQFPIDSVVGFSNYAAMTDLLQHVYDLGYRSPLLAGRFSGGDIRALMRRSAFEEGMRRLNPTQKVRILESSSDEVSIAAGAELFRQARRDVPGADLIMFSSDVFAAGAVLAAHREQVSIPKDVGITGFGGFELGKHLDPPLTTVAVPSRLIGEESGRVLLQRMRAQASADDHVIVDVGYELIEGGSTATV